LRRENERIRAAALLNIELYEQQLEAAKGEAVMYRQMWEERSNYTKLMWDTARDLRVALAEALEGRSEMAGGRSLASVLEDTEWITK
jgi:hypothetical protein